jgi:hypothetical protein
MHSKEKGGKLGQAEIAVLIQWVKIGRKTLEAQRHAPPQRQ